MMRAGACSRAGGASRPESPPGPAARLHLQGTALCLSSSASSSSSVSAVDTEGAGRLGEPVSGQPPRRVQRAGARPHLSCARWGGDPRLSPPQQRNLSPGSSWENESSQLEMQLMMNWERGQRGGPVFALPGNASYSWSLPQREVGTNTCWLRGLKKATLFTGHFIREEDR